jgi:hypothetical protein
MAHHALTRIAAVVSEAGRGSCCGCVGRSSPMFAQPIRCDTGTWRGTAVMRRAASRRVFRMSEESGATPPERKSRSRARGAEGQASAWWGCIAMALHMDQHRRCPDLGPTRGTAPSTTRWSHDGVGSSGRGHPLPRDRERSCLQHAGSRGAPRCSTFQNMRLPKNTRTRHVHHGAAAPLAPPATPLRTLLRCPL